MTLTVLSNATVVSGARARHPITNGAVVIKDDLIADLGPTEEILPLYPTADVYNCNGKAIFPGLINPHAHLTATLHRGVTEDLGFPNSVRLPAPINSYLSDDEQRVMASLGALECIRTGNTTVAEVAQNIQVYGNSLATTGLRLIFGENIADGIIQPDYRPGEAVSKFSDSLIDQGLEKVHHLFNAFHNHPSGRISCIGAAQLVETSSPKLLQSVRSLSTSYNVPYTIHLGQSRLEVQSLLQMWGVRPAQYLYDQDFLSPHLIAAHCRYLDPSEIRLLGQTKSGISHQPAMAARRGVFPPIATLRAAGCQIGLGTDNNTQDMVEVMRTALLTERLFRDDAINPQPEDVLEEATLGSAKVLHLDKLVGSLEPGKKADLFVLNKMRPHLVPSTRIVSGFIHNGQPGDIEAVMVNGIFIMKDDKVLTMDEDSLIHEADRIGQRAWRNLIRDYPNLPFPFQFTV